MSVPSFECIVYHYITRRAVFRPDTISPDLSLRCEMRGAWVSTCCAEECKALLNKKTGFVSVLYILASANGLICRLSLLVSCLPHPATHLFACTFAFAFAFGYACTGQRGPEGSLHPQGTHAESTSSAERENEAALKQHVTESREPWWGASRLHPADF